MEPKEWHYRLYDRDCSIYFFLTANRCYNIIPVMLTDTTRNVLALDIGGSKIAAGLFGEDGSCLDSKRIRLHSVITIELVINTCMELIRPFLLSGVRCVGIAIPGLVQCDKGIWFYSPFGKIKNFPILKRFENELGVPVVIDNDVNLCALAEKRFGVCSGVSDFLWMTISNGIGGAIYCNNNLYRGFDGHAGEIGHIVVEKDGHESDTNVLGSLESYASGRAIANSYRELTDNKDKSITAEDVAMFAREGDKAAISVYEKAGSYMGTAIASAVNLLNLPLIVLGGSVAKSFDLFSKKLIATMRENVFREANEKIDVVQSAFPSEAALIGAAVKAIDGMRDFNE